MEKQIRKMAVEEYESFKEGFKDEYKNLIEAMKPTLIEGIYLGICRGIIFQSEQIDKILANERKIHCES